MDLTNINLPSDPTSWVPALKARPKAALRLISFPYAGGGTPVFRRWPDLLPDTIELRVVQLPGRGPRFREARFHRVTDALDALEPNLLPLLDRPFAFFGHSLGAVLAFEMTCRLQARGIAPVHLFISGKTPPQLPDPLPPIHQLPDGIFLNKLKDLNGMHELVLDSPELLELVLPIIRSDFTMLETHRHNGLASIISCPITVFGGHDDPRTTKEGLAAWSLQTSGRCELYMLPGDHFFIDTVRGELIKTIIDTLTGKGSVHSLIKAAGP